jgi:serine/threonine protein kinase
MELVHSHLAKQPVPPHQLKPEMPPVLSEIVLKLMAKMAEDRYQSAYALKADLQTCLQQWRHLANIANFRSPGMIPRNASRFPKNSMAEKPKLKYC